MSEWKRISGGRVPSELCGVIVELWDDSTDDKLHRFFGRMLKAIRSGQETTEMFWEIYNPAFDNLSADNEFIHLSISSFSHYRIAEPVSL